MKYILPLFLSLLVGCAAPERLEEPPEPRTCLPLGSVCEFDGQCCEAFCANWNRCEDPHDLVLPDGGYDSCVPEQVDIALLVDLSGSMNMWFFLVSSGLEIALPRIPPTTTVQVWVTPVPGADGTYMPLTGPVTPMEALEVVRTLAPNAGGDEATLDAVDDMLRSHSYWRFGTTVRAIVVISDERPQSYRNPPTSRLTVSDVCMEARSIDRLFVFSSTEARYTWNMCWNFLTLGDIIELPDLLTDPCSVEGQDSGFGG